MLYSLDEDIYGSLSFSLPGLGPIRPNAWSAKMLNIQNPMVSNCASSHLHEVSMDAYSSKKYISHVKSL